MFDITFLGTSASAPSIKRNLPAILVKHDEYRFLVDCGEGTQRQIIQAGVGFKNLNRILFTHGHLDHILGVAGLLSTLIHWETFEGMDIYAGPASMERIMDLINRVVLRGTVPPSPVNFHAIQQGVIFETETFSISAFPVFHRGGDSFGYSFQEKGRRPFLEEKAAALEIAPGPWRRSLVKGEFTTLPDGRLINPEDVLGAFKPGTRLVIVGDSGETASLVEHCRDADALVIESTYIEEEADLARKYTHLTAAQGARLALEANVGHLYLTHLSRRYREKDVLSEAQAIFPHTTVARDLDNFLIKRGGVTAPES